ncbi:MAG: hypothetical protein ACTHLJ_10900 [Angustibacter sp.]
MTVLRVWMRRSLAMVVAPVVVVVLTLGAWSRDGWQFESLWGLRAVVLLLPLVSPVVAAGVAFDVARRWGPVMTVLGPSTARWRRATLALVAAHVAWAFAAVGLVWAAAGVRLVLDHAIWQVDPWLPVEVLAALGAAAAVGLLIGCLVENLAAPPLAAVLVFGIEALAGPYGLMSLFAPMGLVDSAVGLERDPASAAWAVALNLGVLVCCCLVALRGPVTTRTWVAQVTVAGVVLGAILLGRAHSTPLDFRASTQPRACARSGAVEVCGPGNAQPFLDELADGLATATERLAGSGLKLPHQFVLGVPGEQPAVASVASVVHASPAGLSRHRRTATLARVLALPRICPQLVDAGPDTTPLLDREAQVSAWVHGALEHGAGTAPPGVVAAYRDLTTCRVT